MLIRSLTLNDVDALVDHCEKHIVENGTDGDPLFAPNVYRGDDLGTRIGTSMALDIGTKGWMRGWGAFDGDTICAHADLRGHKDDHTEHRVVLGMGVRRPYRRQRLGWRLLEVLTAWARKREFAWLDLQVLGVNKPAQSLYRSFGFVEVGCTEDMYRFDGQSIDDVTMTLKL